MVKVWFLLAMDLRKTDGATIHSKNLLRACKSAGIQTQTISFDSLGCSGVEWALKAPGAVAEDADFVFIRSPLAFLSIPLLKLKRKKVVLGVAALKHLESPWFLKPFVKAAEDFAIGRSHAVLTVSPYLAGYCLRHGAGKTLVYLPPIDWHALKEAKPATKKTKKFVVGYVGGRQEWQGIPLLRKALLELDAGIEVRLYGDVDERDLGNDRRVKAFGRVSNKRVPSLLKSFDLCVLPRPHHPSADTATPIKLVEAMACGVPCLATDVAGMKWLLEDEKNAIVCEASADGVFAGLSWALKHEKRLPAIGKRGQARVKEADFREVGKKVKAFLARL